MPVKAASVAQQFALLIGPIAPHLTPFLVTGVCVAKLYDLWAEHSAATHLPPSQKPSVGMAAMITDMTSSTPVPQGRGSSSHRTDRMTPVSDPDQAEYAIEQRASQIANSAVAGTDFDNWMRAAIELLIVQRAQQIAASPGAGSAMENWLRAEHEVRIAQRAEEIARGPKAGTDFDNWIRAEHEMLIEERRKELAAMGARGPTATPSEREARIAARAREIKAGPNAGTDAENWLRAEREIDIADRAFVISASPGAGSDKENWRRAEREFRIADRAREIASGPQAGTDLENWLRAEMWVLTSERAAEIAASEEGATDFDNWIRAEREVRIRKRAEEIARRPDAASDAENWRRAEDEIRAEDFYEGRRRSRHRDALVHARASEMGILMLPDAYRRAHADLVASGQLPN